LRKDGRRVRVSRKVATDRDIQEQEKGVIEYPVISGRDISGSSCLVESMVHVRPDHVLFPFDGKNVEVIRERGSAEGVRCGEAIRAGVSRTVQGGVHDARLLAY